MLRNFVWQVNLFRRRKLFSFLRILSGAAEGGGGGAAVGPPWGRRGAAVGGRGPSRAAAGCRGPPRGVEADEGPPRAAAGEWKL